MGVESAELKIYLPTLSNDSSSNGGHMTASEITSGASGNLFPYISLAERTAGSTKYRKFFFKVADSENTDFTSVKIAMTQQTPADDYVVWWPTTQSSVQSGIAGTEDKYGCGNLNSDISVAEGSMDVYVEEPTTAIFRDGCTIRISNQAYVGAETGTTEYLEVDTVSWNSNVATLTLVDSNAPYNAYLASNTKVGSVYEVASISPGYSNFTVTSAAGTYNDTLYPVLGDNIGGVYDSWTITFSSATAFTCSGARIGSVGSGNTSGDFSPNNADFSYPYFTLSSGGFGGTFTSGDTIEFDTSPASLGVWCKRVVPAGAGSYSGNNFKFVIDGESA